MISSWQVRIVLDTNVLLAGLLSGKGASRKLLSAALDGRFQWVSSVPLFVEYEAVLSRAEHLDAMGLTVKEIHTILDAAAAVIEPVQLRFLWRPQLKDPADEMVLETAVNGQADRVVTFNLRHLEAACKRFGIRAVTPPEMWKEWSAYEKE